MINIKSISLKLFQMKFYQSYAINLFSSSKTIKNTHTSKRNLQGDAILKNYFNKRSEMQHTDFVQLLEDLKQIKVSKTFFHDQRWVHLNVLIEKNLGSFSIKEQLRILNCLTKMHNFNDLFLTIHANLFNKLEQLNGNQKAFLIYYLAKSKKSKPHIYKPIGDSLIQNLKEPGLKISFGKSSQTKKKEQNQKVDEEQKQSESIFEQIEMEKNVEEPKTIDCRLLVLCVWSLHEMKIKDDLLSDLILKQIIKPNIGSISCELFPLLLSTLWVYKLQNKRLFEQITRQLLKRQKQLIQLDKDKLKMLICMLCKPEIEKSKSTNSQQQDRMRQMRKKLVLWLMQTLVLQHESNQIFILSTSAYRILSNVYNANFYDAPLFAKYIRIISQDLTKIQTRQIIYLLSLIQNMRKNIKNRKQQKDQEPQKLICQTEYQILCDSISRKILGFLHQTNQQHSARVALRHLVLTNFIQVNKNIKRNLLYEERQFRTKKYNSKEQESKQQKQSQQKPKVTKKNVQKQKKVSSVK